jgi:hypothetical protein
MMRWIATAVVLLVLGAAGWQLFASHPRARAPVPEVALEPEAPNTPAPVAETRRQAPVMHLSTQNPAGRLALRAKAEAVVNAGRNRLMGSYQSEPRSAAWAMQMEQKLSDQSQSAELASLNANPLDFSVHCRTSTCHITADFPSRTAADDWAMLYVTNGDTGLTNTVYDCLVNPDGSVRVELYGHPRG